MHTNGNNSSAVSVASCSSNGSSSSSAPRQKRTPVFPKRLYDMLENAERDGYAHIISWMPDGQSFKIHADISRDVADEKAFVEILKKNFNQTRFKSFLRQLQLYGFERKIKGPDRGECKHEIFIRGRRDLWLKKSMNDFQHKLDDNRNSVFRSTIKKPFEVTSFMEKVDTGKFSIPLPPSSIFKPARVVSEGWPYLGSSNIPCRLNNLILTDSDSDSHSSCNKAMDDPLISKNMQTIDSIYHGDLLSIDDCWSGLELKPI